ncbi:MAG TPA: ATPase, T2SS/T4P/T4SS family [Solirubrobacteraceae bacterium]|nr:ATPase, T2SS/T4P/T4SS family [Solirubrobacteraceae bacterium]
MDRSADALDALAGRLRDRLVDDAGEASAGDDPAARIGALVEREAGVLDAATRDALAARVAERAVGLGPLEPLLRDSSVDELLVCGTAPVWVERGGRLSQTEVRFGTEAELRHAIERILAPLGRRADEAEPLCDARLTDGSRVNVVLPPLALDGPLLTIRRFRPRGFAPADLLAHGTLTPPLLDFLGRAVAARCTLLICGGTGSGKTTTLGALAAFVDPAERVVTIEDAAELRLTLPHVVRLEARPPNLEGRGEVTIRRLVRNALRMRPDRLIVGEVRGAEALDLLVALSTGHSGSLCTIHAGSCAEALRRLETLALMADVGLPLAAIRDQIAAAVDLVVRQERGPDGVRRIVEVAEVVRVAGGPAVRELFTIRAGRPAWRAPLGDTLAGRLAAAANEGAVGHGASSHQVESTGDGRCGDASPAAGSSSGGDPASVGRSAGAVAHSDESRAGAAARSDESRAGAAALSDEAPGAAALSDEPPAGAAPISAPAPRGFLPPSAPR